MKVIDSEGRLHICDIHIDSEGRGLQAWIFPVKGGCDKVMFIPEEPKKVKEVNVLAWVVNAGYRFVLESTE